jgi:hypothetical protein
VTKVSSKIRRVASALVIGTGGMLLFSSCISGFIPPSDEKRYQYIEQVKTDVDYKNSGKVIEEKYDEGDGVWSASVFRAEIEGVETYNVLVDRIKALPEADCKVVGNTHSRCRMGPVDVEVLKLRDSDNLVAFRLTDSSNGKGYQ